MTREEFDSTNWGAGMKCISKSQIELDIVTVNFSEALIGAVDDRNNYHDADEISWYRCESVELV